MGVQGKDVKRKKETLNQRRQIVPFTILRSSSHQTPLSLFANQHNMDAAKPGMIRHPGCTVSTCMFLIESLVPPPAFAGIDGNRCGLGVAGTESFLGSFQKRGQGSVPFPPPLKKYI